MLSCKVHHWLCTWNKTSTYKGHMFHYILHIFPFHSAVFGYVFFYYVAAYNMNMKVPHLCLFNVQPWDRTWNIESAARVLDLSCILPINHPPINHPRLYTINIKPLWWWGHCMSDSRCVLILFNCVAVFMLAVFLTCAYLFINFFYAHLWTRQRRISTPLILMVGEIADFF